MYTLFFWKVKYRVLDNREPKYKSQKFEFQNFIEIFFELILGKLVISEKNTLPINELNFEL